MGRHNGKVIFAVGPVPGEQALVRLTKQKRTWAEGVVEKLTLESPHRGQAGEDHFLSCSPWQGVHYPYQLELKQQMLGESFTQNHLPVEVQEFVPAATQFSYRNKLEFTLQHTEAGVNLAFYKRGSWEHLLPLPQGCLLGTPAMNKAALKVVEGLNKLKIGQVADTLTVRQSHYNGQIIVALALHKLAKADWQTLLSDDLAGLVVWVPPRRGNPAEMVWQYGQDYLDEEVGGLTMRYPHDSFFQVNIPMFEQALNRVLAAAPAKGKIIELYSGAGTIGLPLAAAGHQVIGVEIVPSSVELATANAKLNHLENYQAILSPSEKIDPELLDGAASVIVDPPRAGLHHRVVTMLLNKLPEQIIYLSCNPATQARDAALLATQYELSPICGFDFYPGTLHLESLLIMTKKKGRNGR